MSFMVKKKRFKFQVAFEVEELSSVPFVNAMLFCKVRLLDGGNFSEFTSREAVTNHLVCWRAKFEFPCKMNANANTGVLETCICRVSVRKELKGGKSYQKLGFADVNLAEFAGGGMTTRKYLLEGYDSKRRQDNSTVKLNIDTALLSGDPLFKAPASKNRGLLTGTGLREEDLLQPENKGAGASEDPSGDSVVSGTSSGFSSLPRRNKPLVSEETGGLDMGGGLGHTRTASGTSEQSKVSGYSSSNNHSRQSSTGEVRAHQLPPTSLPALINTTAPIVPGFSSLTSGAASGSVGGASGGGGGAEQGTSSSPYSSLHRPHADGNQPGAHSQRMRPKRDVKDTRDWRVDSTRVDNDVLVDELVNNFADHLNESGEPSGLQLYITKDGIPVLGGHETSAFSSSGGTQRVIMDGGSGT